MPMVLDIDRYGNVIGVELISIRYYGGPDLFHGVDWQAINTMSGIWFTYTDSDDVLYVKLEQDRSLDQRCVNGRLLIDASGSLAAIEARLA
jgi:uncharacterized protein YuzE